MKKIEKKATTLIKAILPAMYLAPVAIASWSFVSFVQWSS
tara:strand:- start:125 stop:244 length:120 start_codon:yes stop_codon:yes gene_type:complete